MVEKKTSNEKLFENLVTILLILIPLIALFAYNEGIEAGKNLNNVIITEQEYTK